MNPSGSSSVDILAARSVTSNDSRQNCFKDSEERRCVCVRVFVCVCECACVCVCVCVHVYHKDIPLVSPLARQRPPHSLR